MKGVHNLTVDLSHPSDLEAVCAPFLDRWKQAKQICVLHNAAAYEKGTVETLSLSTLLTLFQINIGAAVVLNQIILPFMPRTSSILYVGSTLSEQGTAGAAAYITVKHAVVGLMRATCQDLAGRGIHTACICPGFTDTPMLQTNLGPDPTVRARVAARMSAGRLIAPTEIAELLFFSAQNPVIDGAVLHANLGQIRQ